MLLDSIPQIINNVKIPDKSYFEIIVQYITPIVTLIVLFFTLRHNRIQTQKSILANNKNINTQIENSQRLLQDTIKANREDLIKDKLIDLRIKNLEELLSIKHKLLIIINKIIVNIVTDYTEIREEFLLSFVIFRDTMLRVKFNVQKTDELEAILPNIQTLIYKYLGDKKEETRTEIIDATVKFIVLLNNFTEEKINEIVKETLHQ